MQSDYSNNPLTEVALALSMAFFSIMEPRIDALNTGHRVVASRRESTLVRSRPIQT